MGGFLDQTASMKPERDSTSRAVMLGVFFVLIAMGAAALFLRSHPPKPKAVDPYAATIKLSDIKMSTAQNFVGAQVTYIDGTMTNAGDRTVTRILAHVVFRDSMSQLAQADDVPLRVLRTTGPYPDAVDLNILPLAPGQSQQFRITFEHVSAEWNGAYPELAVTEVTLK